MNQQQIDALKELIAHRNEIMAVALSVCANRWGMNPELIISRNRTQHVSFVRQVAMYLARELSHAPWAQIGQRFERDHSTVIHGWRKTARRMSDLPEFQRTVEELRARCQ